MRIVYFILKFTLNYSLRIFYRRIKIVNSPKKFFGRTIYVSNHANSFMDPLVVASLRMPIVFFMTRSDVFTPISRPFLWACQMLPIYREHDGVDTKKKNDEVFKTCTRILSFGRNLLIFGEGFTDDTFVRRLKPVKKGAARIGFQTLEALQWKKKIYMSAVGCNYSDRNRMRSDLLISTSEKFCLNDYKDLYLENPNRAINEVTKRIEELMQDQITHIEDKEQCNFHEDIMTINRKGLNSINYDPALSLKKRWKYSQNLATWMNGLEVKEDAGLNQLKGELSSYFTMLKRFKLNDRLIYEKSKDSSLNKSRHLILLVILFPLMLLGMIHCFIPYLLVKRFVEKSFKRKVFWGSVKLILGKLSIFIFNIPVIFLFYYFIYPSILLSILYLLAIGIFGLAAYIWFFNLQEYKIKRVLENQDISKIVERRNELERKINDLVPDFNS